MGTAWRSASAAVQSEVGEVIPQDEQLGPARGIVWALPVSLALWCALLLTVGLANG